MAKSFNEYVPIVWRIVALDYPPVVRHCPSCGRTQPFHCSEKFRVNAHKRRVDIWLIYRCGECDGSWKATVHERARPDQVRGFEGYQNNQLDRVRAHAFDRGWLQRFGEIVDDEVPFRIEVAGDMRAARLRIELGFEQPLGIRLDRLLARGLGVSRSRIARLARRGDLVPLDGMSLRHSAIDGGRVEVAREDLMNSRDTMI